MSEHAAVENNTLHSAHTRMGASLCLTLNPAEALSYSKYEEGLSDSVAFSGIIETLKVQCKWSLHRSGTCLHSGIDHHMFYNNTKTNTGYN